MDEYEQLQILLGESRAEVIVLRREKEDLEEAVARVKHQYEVTKAESEKETARANAATKGLNEHLDELKRAGTAAQKLLVTLEEQLRSGDAIRNRLLKVTAALAAIDKYFMLVEAKAPEKDIKEAREAYFLAKVQLGTFDDPAKKVDVSSIAIEDIQAIGIYLSLGAPPAAYIRTKSLGYVAISTEPGVFWAREKLEEMFRGRRTVNNDEPDQVPDRR